MPARNQNEILRFGMAMAEKAGMDEVPESKLLSNVGGITKSATALMREAFVKGVLDRVLQEKVRAMMKSIINAQFTPQFGDDLGSPLLESDQSAGDSDVKGTKTIKALQAIKPDGDRIPLRMFNIDTGNLEQWISGDVNYCILSHSWKGNEVVFPFLQGIKSNVREKEMYNDIVTQSMDEDTRKFAKVQSARHRHLHAGFSDVQLIRTQCLKDLNDKTRKVLSLLPGEIPNQAGGAMEHLTASDVDEIFRLQCKAFEESIAERRDAILPYLQILVDASPTSTEQWAAVRKKNPALGTAVEELLPLLERIRSLQKIEQSIERTKQILDTGLFNPIYTGKRYLWNDTICINKQDANELNNSLAMMGEWYANAEFCLVQIDTPVSEWIETFKYLDKPHMRADGYTMASSNFGHGQYETFKELSLAVPRPKWATRGWTLQELVLPKMAIFVNSVWKPLPRSVEALGPYYYLTSFLAEHVRNDNVIEALHDLSKLREVMATNKIPFIEYQIEASLSGTIPLEEKDWIEKVRRLIGLLDFFGVSFAKNMNEDTAQTIIQHSIDSAATSEYDKQTKNDIVRHFGIDTTQTDTMTGGVKTFIESVIKALVSEAHIAVEVDRSNMAEFGAVPPEECCRGLRRSKNSAYEMLSLAAYRECTVATDRVYSLMGVLGVQFTVFHAEGLTKALSRMLDEVITTTNDVSIFNWSGRNYGSPLRGRSLYPSALEAYDLGKQDDVDVAQRTRSAKAKRAAFNERKYSLQMTCKSLMLLLHDFATLVRNQDRETWDPKPIRKLLEIVKAKRLEELKTQLPVIGKMLSFFQTDQMEMDAAPAAETTVNAMPIRPVETAVTSGPAAPIAAEVEKKSRFGIKAPKVPSIPRMTSLPTASPSLPSIPFRSGSKPSGDRPGLITRKSKRMSEVEDWLSKTDSFSEEEMTDGVREILDGIPAKPLEELKPKNITHNHKPETPLEDAISPNPIIVTTAGVQGLFDVQRVIVEIADAQVLRFRAENAANSQQKINGSCRISTAIASLEVKFRCTAEQLLKQINICDVVSLAIYGGGRRSNNLAIDTDDSLTPKQMESRVEKMLEFVEETDLNMIAGEWILARFSGADASKWFLSTFELGTGNTFYGRRIPTDEIDFAAVEPEALLIRPWERYMEGKKDVMYDVVQNRLKSKDTQKVIDQIDRGLRSGDGDTSDAEEGSLDSLVGKTAQLAGQVFGAFYESQAQQLDAALNDAALKETPKKLRTAIMNLNDNEELVPAMFVSDVSIHIF